MASRLKPQPQQKDTEDTEDTEDIYYNITDRTAKEKFWLEDEDLKIAWENKLAELAEAYYKEVINQSIQSLPPDFKSQPPTTGLRRPARALRIP
jgi:hypothetical protein